MNKDFIYEKRSSGYNGPKTIGAILDEILQSDSRFASAYRKFKEAMADEEDGEAARLFKDIFPQTELAVDLKLFTHQPGRMREGEFLAGMLTRDTESHFSFMQNATKKKVATVRNPHIFEGECINVNRKDDGTRYPTFCKPRYSENFTFKHFCLEAAEELLMVADLLGEENV